jgi:hypothetical protein
MAASFNPFVKRGSREWGMFVHQNHAAGGVNCSIMVGMVVCLCLASQKPSEREFFVPVRTDFGVNSLTAKSVPAGTKNSCPVGFYSRNSTESTLHHKHNNPQTLLPWWCRSPLIWRGINGPARSDARNLFRRGRAGGWWKRII